jgi:glycosyltransferase involved in cell wall biosynthesis
MKIVLYTPSIHTGGGTERVLVNLSNELANRGYHIIILSQTIGKNYLYDLNKTVLVKQLCYDKINQKYGKLFLFRVINKLFGSIILQFEMQRSISKDILTIITFSNSILLECFKTSFRKKLIAFEHWPYWKARKNLKLKNKIDKIYPKLKRVIVLTQHDKKIYDLLGCNVTIIPNSYSHYPEIPANLIFKNVLSIGHFNDQKRRDLLIKSWKIVNDKNPDWTLIIVGDGKLKLECIQQIEKLNLQNSIQIIEPTNEINKYYLKSSIFILSSEYEALPLVLIEAKTFGIPCVSFDIETGPKEIIRDNIDGFLVPFADYKMLAEKTSVIIENIALRKEFGKAARIDALEKYKPKVIYDKWDELFKIIKTSQIIE